MPRRYDSVTHPNTNFTLGFIQFYTYFILLSGPRYYGGRYTAGERRGLAFGHSNPGPLQRRNGKSRGSHSLLRLLTPALILPPFPAATQDSPYTLFPYLFNAIAYILLCNLLLVCFLLLSFSDLSRACR